MGYVDELRLHYKGIRGRLYGLSGPTGLRAPQPPERPTNEPEPETVFAINTHRHRFIKMLKEVAAMHGIDPAEVMERNRRYPVVRVRQEVFVRARDDMNMSFSSIGRIMGLDHATVMHGYYKLKKQGALQTAQPAYYEGASCS